MFGVVGRLLLGVFFICKFKQLGILSHLIKQCTILSCDYKRIATINSFLLFFFFYSVGGCFPGKVNRVQPLFWSSYITNDPLLTIQNIIAVLKILLALKYFFMLYLIFYKKYIYFLMTKTILDRFS